MSIYSQERFRAAHRSHKFQNSVNLDLFPLKGFKFQPLLIAILVRGPILNLPQTTEELSWLYPNDPEPPIQRSKSGVLWG